MKDSKKNTNNRIENETKSKRRAPLADANPDHVFSWRSIPVNEAIIDKMVDELYEWHKTHPEEKTVSEVYLSRSITRSGFLKLRNRHPKLQQAFEVAQERLGNKLWDKSVDRKFDWAAVKHRLYNYGSQFEEDFRFHAQVNEEIKARIREEYEAKGDSKTQFVVVKEVEYRDLPQGPETTD